MRWLNPPRPGCGEDFTSEGVKDGGILPEKRIQHITPHLSFRSEFCPPAFQGSYFSEKK